MDSIILTVVIAAVIALAFVGVVIKMAVDKRRGKHACSCGGNCGACGLCNSDKSAK